MRTLSAMPKSNKQNGTGSVLRSSNKPVLLRVHRSFSTDSASLPDSMKHIYLISASLGDLAPYCNQRAGWLVHIAKLICEPNGQGHLYTPRNRDSVYWQNRVYQRSQWRIVHDNDPCNVKYMNIAQEILASHWLRFVVPVIRHWFRWKALRPRGRFVVSS